MSRKHNSSAPAASYAIAASTGSPASLKLTKLMPLTTRPSFTSRQGMTRIFSMTQRVTLRRLAPALGEPAQNHDGGCNRPQHEKNDASRDGKISIPDNEAN